DRLVAGEPRELHSNVTAHAAGDGVDRGETRLPIVGIEPQHRDRRLDRTLDVVALLARTEVREHVDHLRIARPADLLDGRDAAALVLVLEPERRDERALARAKLIVDADSRDVPAPDTAEILAGRGIANRIAPIDARRDDHPAVRAQGIEPAFESIAEQCERVGMARFGDRARGEKTVLLGLRGAEALERGAELRRRE